MDYAGQQIPILVDDVYEVVDGERRLAAATMLGWDTIQCLATGTFATMAGHIKMTVTKQAELGLPVEPMRPRDINELTRLLLRFYLAQVTNRARTGRKSKLKAYGARAQAPGSINDVIGDMLGLSVPTVSGIRSIYVIEDTADVRWPKLSGQLKQAIKDWEETWPHGPTASSMRSRLYERIRASGDSDVLAHFVTRSAVSEIVKQKHRPVKDNSLLARKQRANVPKGLVTLAGAAAGLRAAGPLSRAIPEEELKSWLVQIAAVKLHLKEVGREINFALTDLRESNTDTEEKQA